jgi:hypothetical protein
MHPETPHTRPEILQALASAQAEVAAFFGGLSDDELLLRDGEAWNPAEHLQHLCTSTSAVARGLGMPWLLLRLRFGRARAPSRGFDAMREVYRARLAAGGGATGAFVPPREEGAGSERRTALLARWARVNARLREALEGWSERDLDRILLPHPLLGKLTTREMLFFTLYHDQHHVEGAKRRLPRFGAGPAGAAS